MRNQKGAGALETLFVCIVVSILIGVVIPYYQKLEQEGKEITLKTGLMNIRKGIELYQALQGFYPADLKTLVQARYAIPFRDNSVFSGEYLSSQTVDPEGNLLDPFGNRYRYNKKDGTVFSGTSGFEKW